MYFCEHFFVSFSIYTNSTIFLRFRHLLPVMLSTHWMAFCRVCPITFIHLSFRSIRWGNYAPQFDKMHCGIHNDKSSFPGGLSFTFCLCQYLDHFNTWWRLPHSWTAYPYNKWGCSSCWPPSVFQLQLWTILHSLGPFRWFLPLPLSPFGKRTPWWH